MELVHNSTCKLFEFAIALCSCQPLYIFLIQIYMNVTAGQHIFCVLSFDDGQLKLLIDGKNPNFNYFGDWSFDYSLFDFFFFFFKLKSKIEIYF